MLNLWDLVDLDDEQLGLLDVARVNLACAQDLPDAGNLQIERCISRLDYLAEKAEKFIERRMPQFWRNPSAYNNSENYYRILCLITFLQRDMGIRYNPAKTDPTTPLDTGDMFIQGVLFGEGGTCGSLPVIYTAVGRRLGYPIRLVQTTDGQSGHLFCRWDDPDDPHGERFNIEASGQGLNCYSDDYYRTGKYQLTTEQEKQICRLNSMTPRQELAGFLGQRGLRWLEFGNRRRAAESFAWAYGLEPLDKRWYNTLARTAREWHEDLMARKPQPFPKIEFKTLYRKFPPILPVGEALTILGLEATENMLNDPELDRQFWEPMRKGLTPDLLPVRCVARFRRDGCTLQLRFKRTGGQSVRL